MVQVHVMTPLQSTEDPERVKTAVTAFWPGLSVHAEPDRIEAAGNSVTDFRDMVWSSRIIDTVREQLLRGLDGSHLRFYLSKQAALHGKISFPASKHPLGDLKITFTVEEGDEWADGEALAWWLCPETADGEIVG